MAASTGTVTVGTAITGVATTTARGLPSPGLTPTPTPVDLSSSTGIGAVAVGRLTNSAASQRVSSSIQAQFWGSSVNVNSSSSLVSPRPSEGIYSYSENNNNVWDVQHSGDDDQSGYVPIGRLLIRLARPTQSGGGFGVRYNREFKIAHDALKNDTGVTRSVRRVTGSRAQRELNTIRVQRLTETCKIHVICSSPSPCQSSM